MKKLYGGLLIVATVFLISCSNVETASANKQWFDTNYTFDTAIINLHNEVITVKVKSWTDYEDGEQLQIVAEDGTVYLTSSYNCTLIRTSK